MIGSDPYPSYEEAEAAGLAWINEHGVEQVFVARSEGVRPLPDIN